MRTILLAIDANTRLERLLPAALLFASEQHAVLSGLFVQNRQLLTGAALPFTREVGANSANCYALTADSIGKRMLTIAESMRRRLAKEAEHRQLPFQFGICEGDIQQITNESDADVVLPGWSADWAVSTSQAAPAAYKAAEKSVIIVVDDGSPSSSHVIEAARRLTTAAGTHRLVILAVSSGAQLPRRNFATASRDVPDETVVPFVSAEHLIRQICILQPTVMLLGRDQDLAADRQLRKKLAFSTCPLAFVQPTW